MAKITKFPNKEENNQNAKQMQPNAPMQQNTQMQPNEIPPDPKMEMEMQMNAMKEKVDKTKRHQMMNKAHDVDFASQNEVSPEFARLPIGEEEIHKAFQTLIEYKQEKAALETKIEENEEFWKMNHWDVVYKGNQKAFDNRVKPKSAWLFNLIINKHADAMDNFPEANILPRARDDEEVANVLSQIIPVIMEQNNYEDVYSDTQWYKCKNGTSVQGVFWNNDKNNGMGDIDIKKIDLLSIFWKGGVTDIQKSPNVFVVEMLPNEEVKKRYPMVKSLGDGMGLDPENHYHLNYDNTEQTAVIDWYYKKQVSTTDSLGIPKTDTKLHYCKFCNGEVIYASENDPNYANLGWYSHGLYPFVFDTLYPIENDIVGLGFIDIEKDDQIYIDKMQQAILESALTNARPRYFFRNDGQVNEEEFLDLSQPLVHVDGNIDDNSIRPLANSQFNQVYENIFLQKIQELKDTSGNTAASQGQRSNVKSASGIASLQEAAGKLSRDSNNGSYRAYRKVINLVIELIRQFYDEPRCFRITGERGENQFVEFDNRGLKPQSQGIAMGIDLGSRLPIVDIEVKPQKRNAYSKETQNQTALNLYNMGFFAPTNTDSALACLDMMDFDQIEKVKDKIQKNGTLMDMLMQMQQQMAMYQSLLANAGILDPNMVAQQQMADQSKVQGAVSQQSHGAGASISESKGSLSSQAASATRGSTAPR